MRYSNAAYIGLLSLSSVHAFRFPFKLSFFGSQVEGASAAQSPFSANETPRIAIIGAGAGGSSAAFWITKAKERFGLDVEVDVYEKANYIGGRSTVVYPHDDKSYAPIELGASIYVGANKNLWRAADEFGLNRTGGFDGGIGIWDGQSMRLTTKGSWWDALKVIWRYGISAPRTTQRLVNTRVKELMTVYGAEAKTWDDITTLADHLGWNHLLNQSAAEYLDGAGVYKPFSRELIESATRVNYGQNLDEIHALGGLISMATDDAVSTEGGNFQIFEQFLNHSSANVFLDTPVDKIVRSTAPDNSQFWTVRSKRGQHAYKSIILAAPIHQTGIKFSFAHNVPPQPYVHLHVTLLTTTAPTPSPEYFKQKSDVPPMMLTTYEGVRSGGVEPEFNSLSYHGLVKGGPNEEGRPKEWTVKIFSKKKVSDAWLKKIFPGSVTWVHRKAWEAYPQLRVSQKFPSFKLHEGLYYVNAFEPFISTMETETLASRNVVDLMLNAQYGTSICGPNGGSGNTTASFVYGWDC